MPNRAAISFRLVAPMHQIRRVSRIDQGGPSRSDTSSRDHLSQTETAPVHWNAKRHGAIAQDRQVEASAVEAYQDSTFAEVVLRQVADKATDQLGLASFSNVPSADAAHDKRAVVVALGEHRANADHPMEWRLQEYVAGLLIEARVLLRYCLAHGIVWNGGVEAKKPAGDRKVGDGLEVEHDEVGRAGLT